MIGAKDSFAGTYGAAALIPEIKQYENREQAWVKHWMLEKYLQRLILKVGSSWQRFVYVDAFAGPWKASEDLSDTSFARALSVMKDCQDALAKRGIHLPMKAIFLEKAKGPSEKLKEYAASRTQVGFEVLAERADFLDKVGWIAGEIKDSDFGFVLVDPTGYKGVASPSVLAPLLKKRGVEILINLMWDHISRFWDKPDIRDILDEMFGEDRCARVISSGLEKEKACCMLYAERLRQMSSGQGGRLWASAFPVQVPTKDRTYYHLFYATHHPVGLLTFDEVAERTWAEQAETKTQLALRNKSRNGQEDMFLGVRTGVVPSRQVDSEQINRAWLGRIPVVGAECSVSAAVMCELLEECLCFESDLQGVLGNLVKARQVENSSSRGNRKTNFVHWHKNEIIRRIA